MCGMFCSVWTHSYLKSFIVVLCCVVLCCVLLHSFQIQVSIMEEGNEIDMNMTKQKPNERIQEEEKRDRLNELPYDIRLHILKFMDTKCAVQTCVLSKEWKDLWKDLRSLSFNRKCKCKCFRTFADYNKFVPRVLSNLSKPDASVSLLDVNIWDFDSQSPNPLDEIAEYAVQHKVQQLTITVNFISDWFFPIMSSSKTLTFLKFSITSIVPVKLTKYLQLPVLESLHLKGVSFTASDGDGDSAEPFSACRSLNTLVIENCILQDNAKALCISNSSLCSLTLGNTILKGPVKIVLSTPNLRSLSVICDPILELSAHNLSFLDQVNIDIKRKTYYHTCNFKKTCSALTSMLQALADYVKILILTSNTLQILNGLSTPDSTITQIPCFVQLMSLKLKLKSSSNISDEEVSRIVEYLLRKSPVGNVNVLRDMHT